LGAIPRLLDLGLKPDIMAGNLIGVIAQRLMRKLCPHCRTPYTPDAAQCHLLGLKVGPEVGLDIAPDQGLSLSSDHAPSWQAPPTLPTLYEAKGCEACDWQGYRGRIAVMEIVRMNEELDDMIARHATLRELVQAARAQGMQSLADDALRRVLDGTTTLAEAARVVDLTHFE
jgi:general secretion pathway protein E/type IV pilus assembly protein PilB